METKSRSSRILKKGNLSSLSMGQKVSTKTVSLSDLSIHQSAMIYTPVNCTSSLSKEKPKKKITKTNKRKTVTYTS